MTVIDLADWRKQPEAWEGHYRRALTVQQLIDKLGFCDRQARVYVRNSWIGGVTSMREYTHGVYDQPSLLLYLNPDEVPQ